MKNLLKGTIKKFLMVSILGVMVLGSFTTSRAAAGFTNPADGSKPSSLQWGVLPDENAVWNYYFTNTQRGIGVYSGTSSSGISDTTAWTTLTYNGNGGYYTNVNPSTGAYYAPIRDKGYYISARNAGKDHIINWAPGDFVGRTNPQNTLPGQHTYSGGNSPIRTGVVPVNWDVAWTNSACIHEAARGGALRFCGLHNFDPNTKCGKDYYYGYFAVCADCGYAFPCYVYAPEQTLKNLDYIITGSATHSTYCYVCPYGGDNFEQSGGFGGHHCLATSWNSYSIKYDGNGASGTINGSTMGNSWHIYGGNTEYEGSTYGNVATKLSENTYYKIGYTFAGWSTTPGGSVIYTDQTDISAIENAFRSVIEAADGQTITLYAVWTSANTTLHIDANGGTYNGQSTVDTTKPYVDPRVGAGVIASNGTLIEGSSLAGPAGYTVTYDGNGGTSMIGSNNTGTIFDHWEKDLSTTSSFKDNNNGTWTFGHTNLGHVDVLRAVWRTSSVILPDCTKPNSVFMGWYDGSTCVGKAGDIYAPSSDITLTAHWSTMSLDATENYIQNLTGTTPYDGYLGAANLRSVWDVSGLANSTYAYRYLASTDGVNYSVVGTDNSNILTNQAGTRTLSPSASGQEVTITYGGVYTITASGAQGGTFGSNAGGKGAIVSADFMLNPGDKLQFCVGGQGGTSATTGGNASGGDTSDTSNGRGGGDATYVYLTRGGNTSLIMVAGGGGGASTGKPGGDAGGYVSLASLGDLSGKNGVAGGGGGVQVANSWGTNGVFTQTTGVKSIRVHMVITGWWYGGSTNRAGGTFAYTPDETVTIGGVQYIGGQTYSRTVEYKFAWVGCTINGTQYGNSLSSTADNSRIQNAYNGKDYSQGGYNNWHEIYLGKLTCQYGNGSHDLYVTGTATTTTVTASYGGGSWICDNSVCAHSAATYATGTNGKTGNGSASLVTPGVVYSTTPPATVLANAQDNAAPNNLPDGDLTTITRTENASNNTLSLTWDITEDNGTRYWFKAGAYAVGINGVANSPTVQTEANTLTLTTGVTQYKYLIDSNPTAAYSASWSSVSTRWSTNSPAANDYSGKTNTSRYTQWYDTYGADVDSQVTISGIPLVTGGERYIHIVAVDRAGNVSAVSNFKIETTLPEPIFGTPYPVKTTQLTIDQSSENVYFTGGVYYIRNDGSPFTINYSAYIDGTARDAYQVEDAYLNSETGRSFFKVPLTALDPTVSVDYTSLTSIDSPAILVRDASDMQRTGNGRTLSFSTMATLATRGVEDDVFVYPQAAAYRENEWALYFDKSQAERLISSDNALDRANGITLRGDITSPAIIGYTPDEDGNIKVNIEDNSASNITFTFSDTGSGIAKITIQSTGAGDVTTAYSSYTNTATATVAVPDDGVYVYQIIVTDNVGNENVYVVNGAYENRVGNPDPSWGSPTPYRIYVTKDTTGPMIYADNVDRSGPTQDNIDDLNGNGIVDEGEVYIDLNGNGHLDSNEVSNNLYEMIEGPTPEENPRVDELPANREYDHTVGIPGGTQQAGDLDTVYCDDLNLVSIAADGTRKYEWTYGWVGGVDRYATLTLWATDAVSGLKSFDIYEASSNFTYNESDKLVPAPKDGESVRLVDGLPVLPASVETFITSDYSHSQVLYVSREGISYYVLKAVDNFNNETYVNLTVKLDRTAPLVEDSLSGLKTTLTERSLAVTDGLDALDKGDFEDATGVNPEDYATIEDTFEAAHIAYYVYVSASDVVSGIDVSGIDKFYLKVTNRDNGLTKIFDTSTNYYGGGSFHEGDTTAGLRINLLSDTDRALFSGDFDLNVVVIDKAYNRSSAVSSLRAFTLKAYLNSKFFPSHDATATYYRGEDVKLIIKTSGFADAIRIELPAELYMDPDTGELSETYIRAFYAGNGVQVLDSHGNVQDLEPNERGIVSITGDIVQIDIDYSAIADPTRREVGECEFTIELLMPYFTVAPDPSSYEIKVTAYKDTTGLTDNDVIDINENGDPANVVKLERVLGFTLNESMLDNFRTIEVDMN